MKRTFLTTILGLLIALGAFAQSGTTGPLTWVLSDSTLTISGNGAMPDYDLNSDAPWRRNYGWSITTVIIQEGVTSIGSIAFNSCKFLTSVTIPNSLKTIGSGTFGGCVSLTSFTIPENVTSIGPSAFYGCSGLTTFNLNAINCKTMGNGTGSVFKYCSALTKINIGEAVQTIPEDAFMECSKLTSVTIPENVTSIGHSAFYGCSLTTLNFNATNCTTTGDFNYQAFGNCSALTTLNIGEAVKTIPDYAFFNCKSLTSVTIPNSVTSIEDMAFYECSALTTVNFNAINCKTKGNGSPVFGDCLALTTLNIGEAVQTIPDYAFYGCESLTSFTIPNSVTCIGDYAFCGCSSINSVTIPDSVTSIGDNSFWGCSSITSVTISKSVTSIGDDAFFGCSSITSVTIPSSVTSVGKAVFCNCSKLISVTIPDSVTSIGDYAFYNCTTLAKLTVYAVNPPVVASFYSFGGVNKQNCVLEVPAGSKAKYQAAEYWEEFKTINEIGSVNGTTGALSWSLAGDTLTINGNGAVPDYSSPSYAPWYSYRDSITAVVIPEGVTTIGSYSFYGCSRLASVTIPNSVTYIGEQAFSDCTSLIKLTVKAVTPPAVANTTFNFVNKQTCVLEVPAGTKAKYQAAEYWKEFYNIKEYGISTVTLEYNADKQKIYPSGNTLVIEGAKSGENVQVYNLAGVLLYSAKLQAGKTTLPLRGIGLYLVRTNSGTTKVLVK